MGIVAKLLTKTASKRSVIAGTKAYIELQRIVRKEAILDRSYGYYAFMTVFIVGGLFISVYNIYIAFSNAAIIGWGILFAFFTVQIGGLLHDAGHRAIFKSTLFNDIVGHFYGALITVGFSDWKYTHNRHHAHPNEEDEDPDIELPFHGFTKARFAREKGMTRLLRKYQVWLFYPIRSFVVFTRRKTDMQYFMREFRPGLLWQIALFCVGLFVWYVAPFLLFDIQKAILVFVVVNFATGFYMSNVFAPNHKGMPQVKKGVKLSFLEHQIVTARNIYGNWLTDFVYMGLNYQIEHHLFPHCPRNKLSRITPFLLEMCKRMKLGYTTVSVLESNKIILRELAQIAATHSK